MGLLFEKKIKVKKIKVKRKEIENDVNVICDGLFPLKML